MAKMQTATSYVSNSKKRRKHSKQESSNKKSKSYKKPYKGQGR
jgi:hypothetical protein